MIKEASYLDWNNSIQILNKAHQADLFVLIIGPKGTGKTSLVREFAKSKNAKLESKNFSLRTRESHLIGTKTLTNGTVSFEEGLLIKSMSEGSMLYLDEINSAEADVLLRLDEALDDRRQITLKESTGEIVKAKEGWFVIETINPLTHSGTKELPPQLLSRFPVRIRLEYPPEDIELEIVKKHVSGNHDSEIVQPIKLENILRQAAAVEELFYFQSLRETITVEFSDKSETKTRLKENRVILTPIEKRMGDNFQKYRQFRTSLWYEAMRIKFCKKILSNDHAFGFILNTMETRRVEQLGRKLWKGMDEEIVFNYTYMFVSRPQLHTVYGKARIVEAFYQYFMFGAFKGEIQASHFERIKKASEFARKIVDESIERKYNTEWLEKNVNEIIKILDINL